MSTKFPPDPVKFSEIGLVLAAYESVVPERNAVFMSTPITTGVRFIDWFAEVGKDLSGSEYTKRHWDDVVMPNCETSHIKGHNLRLRHQPLVVIEPSRLEVDDWGQCDFRYFWGRVIEQYVSTVVFLDGWQYSSGCSYEFLLSQRYKLRALKENGNELGSEEGFRMLQAARSELGNLGVNNVFLSSLLEHSQVEFGYNIL